MDPSLTVDSAPMIAYDLDGVSRRLHDLDAEERTLFTMLSTLARQLGVQARGEALLEVVESMFEATTSWLLLHDPRRQRLRTCAARGAASDIVAGLDVADDRGLLGRVFAGTQLLFVPDITREDDGWMDEAVASDSPMPGGLLLPVRVEDRPIGVLALHVPRIDAAGSVSKHDLARLEALTAVAAVSIENARLFEESERDRRRLRRALHQRRQLRTQVQELQQAHGSPGARRLLLGSSSALERVLGDIDIVARTSSTVLLLGETGTGKELVARAIHQGSRRQAGPFVPVNCAALPEALVESELFGHERGAFTGATNARAGKFQLAHRGTLFLDEVGDLPLEAQAKLLRVLQDGQIERVGSTTSIAVDVRIVAATNADLELALAQGTFRPDLYYRLSVFPIQLPPLRERTGDIPLLATFFANECARHIGKSVEGFSPAALDVLTQHDWPGNVRELRNVVERAVLVTPGPVIEADALGPLVSSATRRRVPEAAPVGGPPLVVAPAPAAPVPPRSSPAAPVTLAEADREAIQRALEATGWRVSGPSGAAALLGLKPTTLHSKMKRLGIKRPRVSAASRDGAA